MISPIQLSGFALHALHFEENPDYEPLHSGSSTLRLYAANVLLEERTSEAVGDDDVAAPFDLRIVTSLDPLDRPDGVPEDIHFFDAFLSVEVNADEETASRTPFRAEVACSGVVIATPFPSDGAEQARALRVLRANSAGLLYGMVRQTLLTVTRSSRSLNLILPSLSFREIVDAEVAQETEEETG